MMNSNYIGLYWIYAFGINLGIWEVPKKDNDDDGDDDNDDEDEDDDDNNNVDAKISQV